MMNQSILVDPEYPQRLLDDLDAYMRHIFDQPLEKAYRRSRTCMPLQYENEIAAMNYREYHSPRAKLRKLLGR